MVEAAQTRISVRRQCELLGLNRSGVYYRSRGEKAGDAELMLLLDDFRRMYFIHNVKPIPVIKNILDIDEIQAVIHDHFSTFFFVPNDRPIKIYI